MAAIPPPPLHMAGQVFTPGSPVNVMDLFAGRIKQLQRIMDALTQRGYHAVLFGERGVGKTSLANILMATLQTSYTVVKVNCDAGDTYSTLWRKAFSEISYTQNRPGIGFTPAGTQHRISAAAQLPTVITPDDVRRLLSEISTHRGVLVILDEFDRLGNEDTTQLVSDTIKSLSDSGVNASILLIGVASSVTDLVHGHASIERALVQIDMPRMSHEEIGQIFNNGMVKLNLSIDSHAKARLIQLSQGLPYIAHLLALHSARAAIQAAATIVDIDHVNEGISRSLEQWQQSIKTNYYDAIKSQQPGNIFKQVLLACSLAEVDELGFFTAASVRAPLGKILGRIVDIPNFASHLKQFSEPSRGEILTRAGEARKIRYRFVSPLMRSYVIIRGHDEGLLP